MGKPAQQEINQTRLGKADGVVSSSSQTERKDTMKKMMLITMCGLFQTSVSAETNALIEVKLFKDWVIKGEEMPHNFNIAIKNTGTAPILLIKHPAFFSVGQLSMRPLPRKRDTAKENEKQEQEYQMAHTGKDGLFELPPEETHVYEGRKFFIHEKFPFSEEMRFTISVYLSKGVWLDSEPVRLKGIIPDSEEHIATITDGVNPHQYELIAITYKNERWLYTKLGGYYFSDFPLSLTNKIRVEPHDGKRLHKIWDGDKSMIYELGQGTLLEGPDENNVFGKWTRERKQRAEADNAEVRRKKAEAAK